MSQSQFAVMLHMSVMSKVHPVGHCDFGHVLDVAGKRVPHVLVEVSWLANLTQSCMTLHICSY
jgi:hypothetical protein